MFSEVVLFARNRPKFKPSFLHVVTELSNRKELCEDFNVSQKK